MEQIDEFLDERYETLRSHGPDCITYTITLAAGLGLDIECGKHGVDLGVCRAGAACPRLCQGASKARALSLIIGG